MNFHKIQQRATLHQRKNLVNRQLPSLSLAPTPSTDGNGNNGNSGNGQNTSINLSRTVDQGPTTSSTGPTSTSTSSTAAATSSSQTSQASSTSASSSSSSASAASTSLKAATIANTVITNPTGNPTLGVASLTATETVQPSASQSAAPSSGTNVGGLVGSIGGGMLGVAAAGFILFFIIKRYRKKRDEDDAFDAGDFRKSAVMLDDEDINAGVPRNPRPPTMIERHVAGPAFQYDQGQYNQYPDAGYGGAYGQAMGYSGYEQSPYPQQQYAYNHAEAVHDPSLPNPFSHEGAPVGAMGYDSHDPASPTNGSPVLSRHPSQHATVEYESAHVHHNSDEYVEMDRGALAPNPRGHLPSAGQPRPISANTVYSPEDAYGGM